MTVRPSEYATSHSPQPGATAAKSLCAASEIPLVDAQAARTKHGKFATAIASDPQMRVKSPCTSPRIALAADARYKGKPLVVDGAAERVERTPSDASLVDVLLSHPEVAPLFKR